MDAMDSIEKYTENLRKTRRYKLWRYFGGLFGWWANGLVVGRYSVGAASSLTFNCVVFSVLGGSILLYTYAARKIRQIERERDEKNLRNLKENNR